MIAKLCKYELKSISRTLFPIYFAVIIISGITSLSLQINVNGYNLDVWTAEMSAYNVYNLFRLALLFVYFAVMVALFVLTAVIILQRFYKGLLGDEGYLMFTLPVKTWQLITSKGLSAFVMGICSLFVSGISIFFLLLGSIPNLGAFLSALFSLENWARWFDSLNQAAPYWWVYVIEFVILMVVGMLAALYQIYVSIAIGHLAKKHRIMMSVVAYLVIAFILSFVGGTWMVNFSVSHPVLLVFSSSQTTDPLHALLISSIATSLVQLVIFFVGTDQILSRKLNLE